MKPFFLCLVAASTLAAACGVDTAPRGLRATPAGDGATVVFDLTGRPLPNIPAPNDVATVADPTSRTGRRINVSLDAATRLERSARDGFNEMEGWGTFAPIWVAFSPGLASPIGAPALDLGDLASRMRGDGNDFANDAVYVVNLKTGIPVALDLGDGSFPVTVADPSLYWRNDTRAAAQNILFETTEEGAGLTQSLYRPDLDTDFDGVLDHPNTFGALAPGKLAGVDDVTTWYERETDTLILRPIVPMEEKTEYAVVLTDRLRGSDGKPVRSPFPFVHHPTQKDSVGRLEAVLASSDHAAYYGDLAGTGLAHVAFAWTFTTQPVYEDMRLLRDGVHGKGLFSRLDAQFPPDAKAFRAIGLVRDESGESPSWASDPRCASPSKRPFLVKMDDAKDALHQLLDRLVGLKGPAAAALEASIVDNVDHIVIGSFAAPYLLGDPAHEDPDSHFHVNFMTGAADVQSDQVQFWLVVPRASKGKQPFDTVMWSHGTAQNAAEIIIRAGYFAKQGLATFAINMPGHGLVLDKGTESVAEVFLRETCMAPWLNGITASRAHDLNGDGKADPGGLLWTSHIFHSRDNIRQSVLDQVSATRLVRAFDGRRSTQDYDGDGALDAMGDFDADGAPDIGGPGARLFSAGDSYGGIVAQIHGALDPNVTATASISGAGGLIDVATRSALVPDSVLEQVFTPLVVAVPSSDLPRDAIGPITACGKDERSVRFVVNDLIDSAEIEIACLSAAELDAGKTVIVTNVTTKETRCGGTWAGGRFRVAVPTNIGDRIDVQIYDQPNAVGSYATCVPAPGAPAGRRIATWEKAATRITQVADDTTSCTADGGCAQFRDTFYPVGSPLVAPNEGLGYLRQSPNFRRLMNLTQAAVDPSDPVNFAPYYTLRPAYGIDGAVLPPRPILSSTTVGDPLVPAAGGSSFARAAGALPFLPPDAATRFPEYADYATPKALYDAWGGRTANQVLVDGGAIESLSRMKRTRGGPACRVNYRPSTECSSAPTDANICGETLFDADWHSEGRDAFDAPHPTAPLRLARVAGLRATDPASLTAAWAPRLRGVGTKDGAAWTADAPIVAAVYAYINALGQHVWTFTEPCKAFDDVVYYDHMMGRFFASGGKDAYFLSHPESHWCMANESCPFFH